MIIWAIVAAIVLMLVIGNVLVWAKVGAGSLLDLQPVSVLIPARDEEANIAACLDSVLRRDKLGEDAVAEVLVYDDHSTDATAELVRQFARRDARVRLLEAAPLPEGWCGKNFACWQLAQAARGTWLLFLDADARLCPPVPEAGQGGAMARMQAEARRRRLTFLSCWPRLAMTSFWEKLLMPMLNVVVFSLFPALVSTSQQVSLAIAHGACILAHRETYFKIGGHKSVRNEIFEDVRLAQLWRRRGERGLCLDGRDVVWVRMYSSFGEIWGGFQKNFFPAFRHPINFWLFLLFRFVVFLGPFLLLPFAAFGLIDARPVLLVAPVVLVIRLAVAVRFGHPLWAVALHPAAEAILLTLGVSSWRRCRRRAGVVWKGRLYRGGR